MEFGDSFLARMSEAGPISIGKINNETYSKVPVGIS